MAKRGKFSHGAFRSVSGRSFPMDARPKPHQPLTPLPPHLLVDTKVKEEVDKGEKDVEEEEQEQEEKEREVKEVWVEEAKAAEHPPASPKTLLQGFLSIIERDRMRLSILEHMASEMMASIEEERWRQSVCTEGAYE